MEITRFSRGKTSSFKIKEPTDQLDEVSHENRNEEKTDGGVGMVSDIHKHDVIIVGGGLTGLRAAIQLHDANINVAIISKVHPLRSHSVAAQGGMNASLGNVPGADGTKDSWKNHAYDTVKGSDYSG